MNCDDVRSKIRLFQENLLPQHDRYAVSEHLMTCNACEEMSQTFIRGNQERSVSDAPLDPSKLIPKKNISNRELEAKYRVKEVSESGSQYNLPWFQLSLSIALCVLIGFSFVHVIRYFDEKLSFLQIGEVPNAELNNSSVDSGGQSAATNSSKRREVFLRPLHWDVYFPNLNSRDSALKRILEEAAKPLYGDRDLLVISQAPEDLTHLVETLDKFGGHFAGGGSLKSIQIPHADQPIKVSISLHAAQSRVSAALTHHWHLRFNLPNRFALKGNLELAGADFEFEAPDLWVIRISGDKLDHLKKVFHETHGVSVNFYEDTVSTESYGEIPITVSLYIEEG